MAEQIIIKISSTDSGAGMLANRDVTTGGKANMVKESQTPKKAGEKDVWGDIVRIYKTYDANNHVLTDAKTLSSKRDIYIQAELKECIERINEYMAWQKDICGYETDIFFPDLDGERLKYYSYSTYLRENSERILGRRITPHTLRHTHCSMLASKGMSLEAISERLGHEDSRITKEIYLHKLEEVKAKERRQLDSIHLIG